MLCDNFEILSRFHHYVRSISSTNAEGYPRIYTVAQYITSVLYRLYTGCKSKEFAFGITNKIEATKTCDMAIRRYLEAGGEYIMIIIKVSPVL